MRVAEDAREVALAQRLAVATQQFARLHAHCLGHHRRVARREILDGTLDERERLVASEAHTGHADGRVGHDGRTALVTRRVRVRRLVPGRVLCRRSGSRDGGHCGDWGRRRSGGSFGCTCGGDFAGTRFALATTTASTATATTTAAAALFVVTHHRLDRGIRDGRILHCAGERDLELAVLQLRDVQQALVRRFHAEARELRHAEVLLVEARVDLLHDLLEAVGAHDVAVLGHAVDRLGDQLPGIVLLRRGFLARLHEAGKRVVAVVLVAVLHEQVAGRFPDADADDVLAVFLELEHERREVRVARQQDVRADLGTGEDELHGIDREADVGGVLLGRAVGRGEDQVDGRLGQRHDVLRIAAPVGVGALDGHLAADDLGRQQVAEFGLEVRPNAHRDVVEVDEEGRVGCGVWCGDPGGGMRGGLGPAVQRSDGSAERSAPVVTDVHAFSRLAGPLWPGGGNAGAVPLGDPLRRVPVVEMPHDPAAAPSGRLVG